MKEYECVQVDNHTKIAGKIQEYIEKRWHLHTYQASTQGTLPIVVHYLLFEKG
jgi:uncharacterized membrane protein YcgQ (UPF0703/DUF1980 family)